MIPNQYHFVFGLKPQTEAFHIAHYLCLASCLEVNQPQQVHFHYCHEPYGRWWDAIRESLALHRLQPETFLVNHPGYLGHEEGRLIRSLGLDYAHHADFIRLKLLLEHGGIYADMDTLFVNPLPSSMLQESFVVAEEEPPLAAGRGTDGRSVCNAVILAEPNAPFGVRWLEEMYEVFDGSWSRHSCRALTELTSRYPDEVCVAPQRYFFKHPCTREGIRTLLEGLDADFEDVYSLHLWAHAWWELGRRDFSNFDAGRLCESYIRSVDTTYNIVARRFLPG